MKMKLFLALIMLGVASGNELRGNSRRDLGFNNLIHKKKSAETIPAAPALPPVAPVDPVDSAPPADPVAPAALPEDTDTDSDGGGEDDGITTFMNLQKIHVEEEDDLDDGASTVEYLYEDEDEDDDEDYDDEYEYDDDEEGDYDDEYDYDEYDYEDEDEDDGAYDYDEEHDYSEYDYDEDEDERFESLPSYAHDFQSSNRDTDKDESGSNHPFPNRQNTNKNRRPGGTDPSVSYGNNKNHKNYPRKDGEDFFYYDNEFDYDYEEDDYGTGSYGGGVNNPGLLIDRDYIDKENVLTVLVGGDHEYTCNKYCISFNAENFENGACSRCELVEIDGNLDVKCEGSKISRSCRHECCNASGKNKDLRDTWDTKPDDGLEAVYDYDVDYDDGVLVTRVGEFFFECDKFCMDYQCTSCDVDADLNVRCERGIVPQGCRRSCCSFIGPDLIDTKNADVTYLEVVHNYKELSKNEDALTTLSDGEIIECSIDCIDENSVRRCQDCEVDAYGDTWCEGGEVPPACIDRCCDYLW